MDSTTAPAPVPAPMAAPPPRRRWWLWLLLLVLVVSLLGNCALFGALAVSAAGGGTAAGNEEVIEQGGGTRRILLVEVTGEISDAPANGPFGDSRPSLAEQVEAELRHAIEDSAVVGVLLAVDSPGGGVTASDRLHRAVAAVRTAGKPVVVHMGDLCASGGYYLSAPADHLVAMPTTITGSIGVIMVTLDVSRLLGEKLGVTATAIKSGALKDLGSPFKPLSDAERTVLQGVVDAMYGRFVQVVVDGRSGRPGLTGSPDEVKTRVRALADGRIYTADQAKDLGLIDEIGYRDAALAAVRRLAKAPDAPLIRRKHSHGLLELLGASAKPAVQIDGASIRAGLTPRLEYRWAP